MPSLITLTSKLKDLSIEWKDVPMLAHRTTGFSYVWGKKLVFVERLEEQMRLLFNIPLQLNLVEQPEIITHIT
jgi:adenylosuccinate lyase